jgi:hypothetical protein
MGQSNGKVIEGTGFVDEVNGLIRFVKRDPIGFHSHHLSENEVGDVVTQ